jgi:hypothetical protein
LHLLGRCSVASATLPALSIHFFHSVLSRLVSNLAGFCLLSAWIQACSFSFSFLKEKTNRSLWVEDVSRVT